ncbi:MAG TPA: ATP-binding protein [Methylomirabilota bacterium]|nr:ATP-binding protein [Methylomirabilota bacterium]
MIVGACAAVAGPLSALRGEPVTAGAMASTASSTVPAGSRMLARQPTVWEQYRWHILALIGLTVAQAALIVGFVVERQRRRRAQEGLAERLRFEALVAEVSATFAGLPTRYVDAHIRDCLRRVALFLGVERGALWRPSIDGDTVSPTHSWTAEGEAPPPTVIRLSDLPFAREMFEDGRPVSFSTPDDLPPEAARERQLFERTAVRSVAAVPLRIGDRTLGVMTFVSLRVSRSWPDEVIQQIRTLGELFANALMRDETAAALEASEALIGAVLTALPGETAVVDRDGVIVQTNEAWDAVAQGHGPELKPLISVGANYLSTCRAAVGMPEEAARTALGLIESVLSGAREDAVLEYPCVRAGRDRWFEMRVRRLARPEGGAAITHSDATERKRAEAASQSHLSEIAHLDRVAALGELAASLAHELNQPLTAILSNAQAARRFLAATPPDLEEVRACLEDITSDDRRASEVIRRMRHLLKKRASDLQPIVVNTLVANAIALVANDALLHAVSIEFAPAPALPLVHGDPIQIQQVVLNLLANGITAASAGPLTGRTVTVSTFARDEHVEIEVRDSGHGIAARDLDRLFEPFFTTKPDGLGMGLAISRSIVEAHGGRVWAENDRAGGALFRVELPVPGQPYAPDRSRRSVTGVGGGGALDFGPMARGDRP